MSPAQRDALRAIVRAGQIEYPLKNRKRATLEALADEGLIVLGEIEDMLVAEPTGKGHDTIDNPE